MNVPTLLIFFGLMPAFWYLGRWFTRWRIYSGRYAPLAFTPGFRRLSRLRYVFGDRSYYLQRFRLDCAIAKQRLLALALSSRLGRRTLTSALLRPLCARSIQGAHRVVSQTGGLV
jgi:hypothetical protein